MILELHHHTIHHTLGRSVYMHITKAICTAAVCAVSHNIFWNFLLIGVD